jgi:hypothetical protein
MHVPRFPFWLVVAKTTSLLTKLLSRSTSNSILHTGGWVWFEAIYLGKPITSDGENINRTYAEAYAIEEATLKRRTPDELIARLSSSIPHEYF